MRLKLTLSACDSVPIIPINYQYPLSAAIYKVIQRANDEYAAFLHEKGYGKGFKLFTFSDLRCPFRISDDRLILANEPVTFQVSFHLPDAIENFIKGLFQTETINIADKKSKASFRVASVESLKNELDTYASNQIVSTEVQVLSPVVVGLPNERGNYTFLEPNDQRFTEVLIYNCREKIKTCFDATIAENAILMIEILKNKYPPKSRLLTIKSDTPQQTKIRGWSNFRLKVTAEKRFIDVLMNCGVGVYNSMGCGMVG